jgi:hypothetical protein
LQIFGSLTQHYSTVLKLDGKSHGEGSGETILTDGVLEGQSAPDYVTNVLPGLKLTQYRFRRMSNDFITRENGDAENRMIFEGQAYDIFIFGISHYDERSDSFNVRYTLGVDLLVSLGSKVLTRTLDQGKLPVMYYWGRIKGSKFAEMDIRYLLPHEFAYEVFIRRNILLQLLAHLGEKPPTIEQPKGLPLPPARDTPAGP